MRDMVLVEGMLYGSCCQVVAFKVAEQWGGGEDALGFGCQCVMSHVHFQSKFGEVVVDKFHPLLQVLLCSK